MSARTLRRKLDEEGLKYQTLVDNAMKDQAMDYLNNTQWPIEEIADLMGYSDASNFNKAFKRWFGKSAASYRA